MTPSEENFNNYAKISITSILYRVTTLEVYLEPSQTPTMELFCKNNSQQAHNVYTTLVPGHNDVTSYMNVYATLLQPL